MYCSAAGMPAERGQTAGDSQVELMEAALALRYGHAGHPTRTSPSQFEMMVTFMEKYLPNIIDRSIHIPVQPMIGWKTSVIKTMGGIIAALSDKTARSTSTLIL